jgi:hypothetical protein
VLTTYTIAAKIKLRASVYTAYFIVATECDKRSELEFKLRRYRAPNCSPILPSDSVLAE